MTTTAISIDGTTGQPVVVDGRFARTDAIAARVLARLRTEEGSVPWGSFGSRLHRVRKADALAVSAVRAELLRAVQPEVEAGAIRDVVADVELQGGGAATVLRWELRYTTAGGAAFSASGSV